MNESSETKTLYTGRHIATLAIGSWEYVTRKVKRPAVGIVAITDERKLVLVEQYRPPARRNVVELPAGLAGDVAGTEDEPLLEAAKRELLEETGYVATKWTELTAGYTSPGLTDELVVLFLARGLQKQGSGGGDVNEEIIIHEVPVDHVFDWLQEHNHQVSLKLFAGVYLAQHHLNSVADGH